MSSYFIHYHVFLITNFSLPYVTLPLLYLHLSNFTFTIASFYCTWLIQTAHTEHPLPYINSINFINLALLCATSRKFPILIFISPIYTLLYLTALHFIPLYSALPLLSSLYLTTLYVMLLYLTSPCLTLSCFTLPLLFLSCTFTALYCTLL